MNWWSTVVATVCRVSIREGRAIFAVPKVHTYSTHLGDKSGRHSWAGHTPGTPLSSCTSCVLRDTTGIPWTDENRSDW